jgi:uncharacterized protein (TIGR00369 family)
MMQPMRTRSYSWEDPSISARAAATMDGLAFLRAIAAGELPAPPIAAALGFTLRSVEAGRAVFALEPDEPHFNPIGSMHGGVFATLLDSACGCAVQSRLPNGTMYTSLDLSVKFLRGARLDTGTLLAEGTVTHLGRRTALAEARLTDEAGTLYASATSTCLLLTVEGVG